MFKLQTIFYLTLLLASFSLSAQKVVVQESVEKVTDTNRKGQSILLEYDDESVEKLWIKYLKELGKVEKNKDREFDVLVATVREVSTVPVRVLSKIIKQKNGTLIFWTIDFGDSYLEKSNKKYDDAAKLLHDFGVKVYISDINEQIEEAQKETEKAVKNQERKIKDGEKLIRNIEKNKQEKIELEKKIEINGRDLLQLNANLEQNKLDQKTAELEVETLRKAVDATKAKLLKVE